MPMPDAYVLEMFYLDIGANTAYYKKNTIRNRRIKIKTLLGNYEKTYRYSTISIPSLFVIHRVTFRFFSRFYPIRA